MFYDRALRHRLTKTVRNDQAETIAQIAAIADRLRATIPVEQFDFDVAKAGVMGRTRL